jgi:hypothetical protein
METAAGRVSATLREVADSACGSVADVQVTIATAVWVQKSVSQLSDDPLVMLLPMVTGSVRPCRRSPWLRRRTYTTCWDTISQHLTDDRFKAPRVFRDDPSNLIPMTFCNQTIRPHLVAQM